PRKTADFVDVTTFTFCELCDTAPVEHFGLEKTRFFRNLAPQRCIFEVQGSRFKVQSSSPPPTPHEAFAPAPPRHPPHHPPLGPLLRRQQSRPARDFPRNPHLPPLRAGHRAVAG